MAADISKYNKNILNIVIIIIALVFSSVIFNNQNETIKKLQSKIIKEEKKIVLLKKISELEKISADYKKLFGEVEPSTVINSITTIAKRYGISVVSVKPEQEKKVSFYMRYPYRLSISAKGYHEIGRFIAALENYNQVFIVDSFEMKMPTNIKKAAGDTGEVTVELKLAAISLQSENAKAK